MPGFKKAAEINQTEIIAAIVRAIDKDPVHAVLRPSPALWGNHILEFGDYNQIRAFLHADGRLLPDAPMRGRKRLADHLVMGAHNPETGENLAAVARICLAAGCGIKFDDKALGLVPNSRQKQIRSALMLLKADQTKKITSVSEGLAEVVGRVKTTLLCEPA